MFDSKIPPRCPGKTPCFEGCLAHTCFERLPQDALRDYAAEYADQFPDEDPACIPLQEIEWRFVPKLPIAAIGSLSDWRQWFADEDRMSIEDGRNGYRDLLEEPTHEPVVAVAVDGEYYFWDGNHRVGAAATRGDASLPAIVGYRRAQSVFAPQHT